MRQDRKEVCYRERQEKVYMFRMESKEFYESADFCHLLGGTLAIPRTQEDLADLESKCYGFTGWNDINEEGKFVNPYTNEVMVGEALWNTNEPNNYGGSEDCTDVRWSKLNHESCSTRKSCVLCSLSRNRARRYIHFSNEQSCSQSKIEILPRSIFI